MSANRQETSINGKPAPLTLVVIGAGNRTSKYLHYILGHPDEVKLVGVVEINDLRRRKVAEEAGLKLSQCFRDVDSFFLDPVKADAVLICTPENAHFRPAMLALDHGYHVLLEKPIAQTLEECRAIAEKANSRGLTVGICHVLRYHPYFRKFKELIDGGELGEIVSVDHRASVGLDRATHSYVRGIFNREEKTNPVLLSKCCHDVDFIVWLIGAKCRRLSSFGSLRWFTSSAAPEGASERCIDCRIERECPYSAVNLYKRRGEWTKNFDVPPGSSLSDVVDKELESGAFGRCVYHCDNDVADHQVLSMIMENDVTVNLSMDFFTLEDHRITHICLTHGEIYGDESQITVHDFRTRTSRVYDFRDLEGTPFHAGADLEIIRDFVNTLRMKKHGSLLTDINDSIESHRICFNADVSMKRDVSIG
ncbi:MAG: Gfo/Idh/MocA family oxidoreductase [Muribaculaceae bacterium]|nr:Gfo/Idh/MocA family oxidoreductase [Muribaculaceae bacterium]